MAIHLAIRARILSSLVIFGILLASCGSSSTAASIKGGPGVDVANKTITVGIITPLTGPVAAPIGLPLTHGIETYFKYINDNGGVDGYKILYSDTEEDSMYSIPMQITGYNAIHNQVAMIAESLGSPTTASIVSLSNTDKLLVNAATLDSGLARDPYMILVGTPYRLQVENGFDYVVNKLGVTNPKTGIIYQNDQYGQDGLAGYKEAIACYGLNDVGQATYNNGDTMFSAQVLQLQAAGAQYVFLSATPSPAAGIIGTAHKLGYDPHWILQSPAFATGLLKVPGLDQLLAHEAMVVGQGATWGDMSKPGMVEMLQNIQKYIPNQGPDGFFEFGYAEAKVTYAILKQAADNKDLSRDGLLKAFNSLQNVDVGGLYPTLHYGSMPNQRVPSRDNSVYGIDLTAGATAYVKDLSGDFTGTCAAKSNF